MSRVWFDRRIMAADVPQEARRVYAQFALLAHERGVEFSATVQELVPHPKPKRVSKKAREWVSEAVEWLVQYGFIDLAEMRPGVYRLRVPAYMQHLYE